MTLSHLLSHKPHPWQGPVLWSRCRGESCLSFAVSHPPTQFQCPLPAPTLWPVVKGHLQVSMSPTLLPPPASTSLRCLAGQRAPFEPWVFEERGQRLRPEQKMCPAGVAQLLGQRLSDSPTGRLPSPPSFFSLLPLPSSSRSFSGHCVSTFFLNPYENPS